MRKLWSRWYERDKDLLSLVDYLKASPPTLQETLSTIILEESQRIQTLRRSKRIVLKRTATQERGVLKSMHRRRWYDQNITMFKAFNALYLMEPLTCQHLAQRMNEGIAFLNQYLESCKRFNKQADASDMTSLLRTCVSHGPSIASMYLEELENQANYEQLSSIKWQQVGA